MDQEIADLMKWLHQKSGLDRAEFARRIGVSRYAVLYWEKGEAMVPLDRFLAACEAAGVLPMTAVGRLYGQSDE